jgi:hypothetical protein
MLIIDEENLYEGTVYHTIGAVGETEQEYLYFAQPRESKMKCQYMHDINSEEIELQKDLCVMKYELEPEEPKP